MQELKPPVIIIGSTRSGTTILARLLAAAPGMCLLDEAPSLWRTGYAYRSHDVARAADAKQWVKRHIRQVLFKHQVSHGNMRIVEKTPSNSLRVGFVRAILPDAPIIHIVRDGRAMVHSQIERYRSFYSGTVANGGTRQHLAERLSQTVLWEWPAYCPRLLEGVMRSYVLGKPVRWFGVRYPGWKVDRRRLGQAQLAAKQWVVAVETALTDLQAEPLGSWLSLQYEDLVDNPRSCIQRVCEYCGITTTEAFLQWVADTVHPRSKDRWREELDRSDLQAALPILQGLLHRLGYDRQQPGTS